MTSSKSESSARPTQRKWITPDYQRMPAADAQAFTTNTRNDGAFTRS